MLFIKCPRTFLLLSIVIIPLLIFIHSAKSQPIDNTFDSFVLGLTFVTSNDGRAFTRFHIQPPRESDLKSYIEQAPAGQALQTLIAPEPFSDLWAGADGVVKQSETDEGLAISHDGKQIVFSLDRDQFADLFVANMDGSAARRLTKNSEQAAAWAENPRWSPTDSSIIFDMRSQTGDYSVYSIQPDGTELKQLLHQGYRLRTSPIGNKILYNIPEGAASAGTYVGDLLTFATISVNNSPILAEWSPSGMQIAFNRSSNLFLGDLGSVPGTENTPDTQIMTKTERLTNGSILSERKLDTGNIQGAPLWSPSGEKIVFGTMNNSLHLAYAKRLGSLNLTPDLHTSPVIPLLWSPDSRYLLYRAMAEGIFIIDTESRAHYFLLPLAAHDLFAAVLPLLNVAVAQDQISSAGQRVPLTGTSTNSFTLPIETATATGVVGRLTSLLPLWLIAGGFGLLAAGFLIFSLYHLFVGGGLADLLSAFNRRSNKQEQASNQALNLPVSKPAKAKIVHPYQAFDTGGTLALHGPEITDQQLIEQLQTGVAPDGTIRPIRAATRFSSYDEWLNTRQTARHQLGLQLQLDDLDLTVAPQAGQPPQRKITINHSRYIGNGFVGQGRPIVRQVDGKAIKVYARFVHVAGIAQTTTTFCWRPETQAWEVSQHYPEARKKLGIMVRT